MLINLKEILKDTRKKKYAVGLFNCVTLEMTKGIIAAAEELSSPVIIGPAESLLTSATLAEYGDMMLGMAKRAKVPVALHFDHGFSPDLVKEAIRFGYTSVMYDCSMLSYDENLRRIKDMVKYAHDASCSLEAEIGHVGSNGSAEGDIAESIYTKPEEARRFAVESGCDALAVAIGTAHGTYKETPKLNTDCLSQIASQCDIPLVLHGGSGLSKNDFQSCIKKGISKINIFTNNNLTAAKSMVENYNKELGAFEMMPYITEAVKLSTMEYIRIFGSDNKA